MSDLIDKQQTIDAVAEALRGLPVVCTDIAKEAIEQLPSTQPERIKGRWIAKEKKNLFRCSKCDAVIYSESEYDRNEFYKFCGRCGADMREVTT